VNVLEPRVFRLPKAGSSRAEYEDSVACSRSGRRFAVADGASASAFARLWARLLVHAYTAGWLSASTIETDLAPIQARWSALVDSRDLAWYAAEQARRGAFAALVGLSLESDGQWTALAVGDCCLFQLREDALVAGFPLTDPDAFDNRPMLLGSRAAANRTLRDAGAIYASWGTWRVGDTFLLMSDALAAAFLRLRLEQPVESAAGIAGLEFDLTRPGFRAWVRSLRARRLMRNDDVSLLWLPVNMNAAA
jgi:protein phosphatase 2C-like protein